MAESNHKVRHVTQDQEAKHKDYTFQASIGDITNVISKEKRNEITCYFKFSNDALKGSNHIFQKYQLLQ